MGDPTYPLIPVLSALCFGMTILPLTFISPREHPGIAAFMAWQSIACFINFTNHIVWNGSIVDYAPIWCDVSTRLELGIKIGVPASMLCMVRAMCLLMQADPSSCRKRLIARITRQTLLIAFIWPLSALALNFFVSYRRYLIVEDHGCKYALVHTWLSIVIYSTPPAITGAGTVFYWGRAIYLYLRIRIRQGQAVTRPPMLGPTLIFTLLLFATLIPMAVTKIAANFLKPLAPHPSVSHLRINYDIIDFFAREEWNSSYYARKVLYLTIAEHLVPSACFFFVFGTGKVARTSYINLIRAPRSKLSAHRSPKAAVIGLSEFSGSQSSDNGDPEALISLDQDAQTSPPKGTISDSIDLLGA